VGGKGGPGVHQGSVAGNVTQIASSNEYDRVNFDLLPATPRKSQGKRKQRKLVKCGRGEQYDHLEKVGRGWAGPYPYYHGREKLK